jgi:hypothetical protein
MKNSSPYRFELQNTSSSHYISKKESLTKWSPLRWSLKKLHSQGRTMYKDGNYECRSPFLSWVSRGSIDPHARNIPKVLYYLILNQKLAVVTNFIDQFTFRLRFSRQSGEEGTTISRSSQHFDLKKCLIRRNTSGKRSLKGAKHRSPASPRNLE